MANENNLRFRLTATAYMAYSACMSSALTKEDVLARLRKRQGKKSIRAFASELGLTPAYISDIYRGRRDPGPSVLQLLGIRKEESISYVIE